MFRNPKIPQVRVDFSERRTESWLRNGKVTTIGAGVKFYEPIGEAGIVAITSKNKVASGAIYLPIASLIELCWKILAGTGELDAIKLAINCADADLQGIEQRHLVIPPQAPRPSDISDVSAAQQTRKQIANIQNHPAWDWAENNLTPKQEAK